MKTDKIKKIVKEASKEEARTCSLSIPVEVLDKFKENCKKLGIKYSRVVTEFMKDFNSSFNND